MKKQIARGLVFAAAALCFSLASGSAMAADVSHKIKIINNSGVQLSVVNANQIVTYQKADICGTPAASTIVCPQNKSLTNTPNTIDHGSNAEVTMTGPAECSIASYASFWKGKGYRGQLMCAKSGMQNNCNSQAGDVTCTITPADLSDNNKTINPQ